MISKFPYIVLLPGLAFIAVGIWYHYRANKLADGSELGTRLAKANRQVGNVTIGFGLMVIVVAIPLVLAIRQLN